MTEIAILYDSSKCVACKGCQISCKQWNNLPSPLGMNEVQYSADYESLPDLNGDTRLLVTYDERGTAGGVEWAFGRRSCFHCSEPACLEVCTGSAISKLPDGTVMQDNTKCVDCKYCTAACPFGVPKCRESLGVASKCTLCADRVAMGRQPACVQTCPVGALTFGPRDELVAVGKQRVQELTAEGFDKAVLYGEKEMGGMHVLHVAKYGLEAHRLVKDPAQPDAVTLFEIIKPLAGLGIAAVAGGLAVSFVTGIGYEKDELHAEGATKEEEE
jgi:formate dehydrogenase iron-sulfur subunit